MKTSHGFEVFGEEGQQDLEDLFEDIDKRLKTKEAKLDLVEGLQAITKVFLLGVEQWVLSSFWEVAARDKTRSTRRYTVMVSWGFTPQKIHLSGSVYLKTRAISN